MPERVDRHFPSRQVTSSACPFPCIDRIGVPGCDPALFPVSSTHEVGRHGSDVGLSHRRWVMSERNHPAQPPAGVGLSGLREAAAGCRACELWEPATQTVFGEGPETARIVFVGEQPGDQEDRAGEPFVGPAGRLLDKALAEAGIDRRDAYITNAVKHFKFAPVGEGRKRRIHKAPNLRELTACRPWLEAEVRRVNPELVVALGATAGKSLLGNSFKVSESRGAL